MTQQIDPVRTARTPGEGAPDWLVSFLQHPPKSIVVGSILIAVILVAGAVYIARDGLTKKELESGMENVLVVLGSGAGVLALRRFFEFDWSVELLGGWLVGGLGTVIVLNLLHWRLDSDDPLEDGRQGVQAEKMTD